jgi:hypothetical protein
MQTYDENHRVYISNEKQIQASVNRKRVSLGMMQTRTDNKQLNITADKKNTRDINASILLSTFDIIVALFSRLPSLSVRGSLLRMLTVRHQRLKRKRVGM